jgi:purine-binding chemotaxis protein CheW
MCLPTEDQYFEGLVAIEARMVTLVSLAGLFGEAALAAKRSFKNEPTPKAA